MCWGQDQGEEGQVLVVLRGRERSLGRRRWMVGVYGVSVQELGLVRMRMVQGCDVGADESSGKRL